MQLQCKFVFIPEGREFVYSGTVGDTYEDALLSCGINPDTALIFSNGKSQPQDKKIEEEEVEIFLACSRG